ncbi:MAG: 2-amino-4-hydroxy-6-hydroxymethyldihydropteridine diphosphokinase [Myxococcaceae bacterium]|nr:2-amino-4-hydroxy-6-hydroxymethyldihydropteridine diphosphokinase [Myxococcaceae bacterium]
MNHRVYIGIGSNLGDRERNLFAAVGALRRMDTVAVRRCSSIYESAPVGPPQPRFLNAVVEVDTALPPLRLLSCLKQIEADLGRVRRKRWGPREIDLDILLWVGEVIAEPQLQVPHLELHKRRFALEPLCELAPDVEHPVTGERMCELLQRLAPQDCVKCAGPDSLFVADAD